LEIISQNSIFSECQRKRKQRRPKKAGQAVPHILTFFPQLANLISRSHSCPPLTKNKPEGGERPQSYSTTEALKLQLQNHLEGLAYVQTAGPTYSF
jgi:hypothetical protein